MKRTIFATLCLFLISGFCVVTLALAQADNGDMALLQGYDAFRNEDWVSSLFFFRKAVSSSDAPEETWYMLILSEMFAEEYDSAVKSCNQYVAKFPSGEYYSFALYQRGRALYNLGLYDESVAQLTEFCHLYPDHEMYASALFWIAESFFDEYNYSAAKVLYERVVSDFPRDAKAVDSQTRLRTIGQAEREEKLLYLLRVTGEEYLAAREEYERQLRQYQSQDSMGLYSQLQKSTQELEQMQETIVALENKNAELENKILQLENSNNQLRVSAEEARRVAAEVAAAAGKASLETQAAFEASQAAYEQAMAAQATATQNNSQNSSEEEKTTSASLYPELEELKRKAAELERLLEKNFGGATNNE